MKNIITKEKSMEFNDVLWNEIREIHRETLALPIIQKKCDGTLSREKFYFYLKQDKLYLNHYARAIALFSAKVMNIEDIQTLSKIAAGTTHLEQEMQGMLLSDLDVNIDIPMTMSCAAITGFLISTIATKSTGEALAVLLASRLIYREVGRYIYESSVQNNPYQMWINTYVNDQYDRSTDKFIQTTNTFAKKASPEERDKMIQSFVTMAKLEWRFWKESYGIESWN